MRKIIAAIVSTLKKRAGFTLIEVLVSLGLLAMVIWIAGGAVYMATSSYGVTARMQDDEYAARTAMLNISRELHRGWQAVQFVEPFPVYADPPQNTIIDYFTPARLNLWKSEKAFKDGEGPDLSYSFDDDTGKLARRATSGTPVAFESLKLADFKMTREGGIDSNWNFIKGEVPRVKISLTCENGLEVSTVVALLRIPPASPATS